MSIFLSTIKLAIKCKSESKYPACNGKDKAFYGPTANGTYILNFKIQRKIEEKEDDKVCKGLNKESGQKQHEK